MNIDIVNLILSIAPSLAIALLSVAFSHYVANRLKFNSTLKGLVTELSYNLRILSEIRELLKLDEDAEKEGKQALITFPKPHRYAFNYFAVEGHLLKLAEDVRLKLLDAYIGLDIISMYLDHYVETKYGMLLVVSGAPQIRRALRDILLNHLIPATELRIRELLNTLVPRASHFANREGDGISLGEKS